MTHYTIWSRGRELGNSNLAFARVMSEVRAGWFYPTDDGMLLMPRITGEREAWLNVTVASKRGELAGLSPEEQRRSTPYADVFAAAAHADALQLELRGPDGNVIPTEDIDIRDTELFVPEVHGPREDDDSIELTAEQQAEVDEMLEFFNSLPERAPWEPEPEMGRYQLFVTLKNEWDIP